ncbi:MAG: flagellin [Rhizomicrobium sp.]
MSVDRVANLTQANYLSAQMMKRETEVSTLSDQIASGNVSTTYAGYGDQTQAMESARAVVNRTTGYQTGTTLALTQVELQDSQLEQLSSLADELKSAISDAVSTNDGSSLSTTCSGIFDQAKAILNYQDSNGSYIYSGGNDGTAPFTVSTFADLATLSSSTAITDPTDASYVFTNGSATKSVTVADSQTVSYGITASDIGTKLMSTLYDISNYITNTNAADFTSSMDNDDVDFLTTEISTASTAYKDINQISAVNGNTYQTLETASDTQTTMIDLYKGFVSGIQDVDMATASTDLTNAQTALQATVLVTSTLNQISLLDYLS